MNVWQALILGAVQGLTEFLPVSSSGHLLLLRELFGLGDAGVLFDVMLHVGTLLAVVVVFRRDIAGLFRPPFGRAALILFASIPAAVAGFLLSDVIDGVFGSGDLLFVSFAFTAVILIFTRRVGRARDAAGLVGKRIGICQAAAMGIMQAVALIPGVSRSASTVFGGVVSGGERSDVASFAFLMSIPVIIGSALLGLTGGLSGSVETAPLLIGMAAAFLCGLVSASAMLKIVLRGKYLPLIIYLFALSVFTLVMRLV